MYLFNSTVSGVKICKEEIELIESVVDFGNYKLFLVKQSNDLKLWKYMANGNQLIDKPESSGDVFNGIRGTQSIVRHQISFCYFLRYCLWCKRFKCLQCKCSMYFRFVTFTRRKILQCFSYS